MLDMGFEPQIRKVCGADVARPCLARQKFYETGLASFWARTLDILRILPIACEETDSGMAQTHCVGDGRDRDLECIARQTYQRAALFPKMIQHQRGQLSRSLHFPYRLHLSGVVTRRSVFVVLKTT